MAQYTIEDIEILRQKSGISYEEAVNLLEYHNGSLARALVDLEKNGRIKDAKTAANSQHKGRRGLLNYLYWMRVKVTKGNIVIINLSVLFMVFALLVAPWVLVIGAIVALLLGYKFGFERESKDFSGDSLEHMMKNAGSNVRNTMFTIAKDIGAATQGNTAQSSAPQEPEFRAESPASGTTPVNVQLSEDGSIHVSEDSDGFHEADIQ